jgi:hypothetical protein
VSHLALFPTLTPFTHPQANLAFSVPVSHLALFPTLTPFTHPRAKLAFQYRPVAVSISTKGERR